METEAQNFNSPSQDRFKASLSLVMVVGMAAIVLLGVVYIYIQLQLKTSQVVEVSEPEVATNNSSLQEKYEILNSIEANPDELSLEARTEIINQVGSQSDADEVSIEGKFQQLDQLAAQ